MAASVVGQRRLLVQAGDLDDELHACEATDAASRTRETVAQGPEAAVTRPRPAAPPRRARRSRSGTGRRCRGSRAGARRSCAARPRPRRGPRRRGGGGQRGRDAAEPVVDAAPRPQAPSIQPAISSSELSRARWAPKSKAAGSISTGRGWSRRWRWNRKPGLEGRGAGPAQALHAFDQCTSHRPEVAVERLGPSCHPRRSSVDSAVRRNVGSVSWRLTIVDDRRAKASSQIRGQCPGYPPVRFPSSSVPVAPSGGLP